MTELLALPDWQSKATTLDDWVAQLSALGTTVVLTRESTAVAWIEVASHRFRGYAVLEGSRVEAINFELTALDPQPATDLIDSAARALGWEVHPDDPEDEPDEDDGD